MDDDPLELRARWSEPPFRDQRSALLAGRPLASTAKDWRGVDLRGARIDGSFPSGVQLDFARLDGASMQDMDLSDASLSFASAVASWWTRVSLNDANFAFANFAGASLAEASLDRSVLVGASFAGADLRAASLHAAALRGCDLEGAWLWGATLSRLGRRSSEWRLHARRMGYETFADILEDGGYMQVMRMSHARTARAVEGLAWGSPLLDREIVRAVADEGWRPKIVAAAAALLGSDRLRRPDVVVAALWRAIDSRAAPQLVVACALLDPSFAVQARAQMAREIGARSRQALGAMLGEAGEAEGAVIALRWRSKLEEWVSPAARSRWVCR